MRNWASAFDDEDIIYRYALAEASEHLTLRLQQQLTHINSSFATEGLNFGPFAAALAIDCDESDNFSRISDIMMTEYLEVKKEKKDKMPQYTAKLALYTTSYLETRLELIAEPNEDAIFSEFRRQIAETAASGHVSVSFDLSKELLDLLIVREERRRL